MKNVLIVIDVQNDYFPGGAWPLEGAEEATAEIVGAVRQAYKEGWMVVGIKDVAAPDAPFLRPGSPGTDILSAVAGALGGAVVLRKKEADSFYNTGLEELLRGAGITDIWLTGMMTQHGAFFTGEGHAGTCSGKKVCCPDAGAQCAGPERAADAVQGEVKIREDAHTHPPLFRCVMSDKGLRPAERPPPFAGADIKAGLETLAERYR
ncbi:MULTISPECIES: isochorismatase family protein [Enterobacteriaceae]|uniref:isochorismatase family protein n=1 Tax=Enterobacteriaceae TaxID=543 RepID=UPI00389ADD2E|nr:isochorismatase family protein [Raoultella terrigena]